MKLRITKQVSNAKLQGLEKQKTKAVFHKLSKLSSSSNILGDLYAGRMAGLHSYNVLDSDEYIQTKKIENRIKTFDLKLRDKQARAAKRAAEAARIEAERNTGNASDVN